MYGWQRAQGRAGASHRRELLRDNVDRRHLWRRHGLQDHAGGRLTTLHGFDQADGYLPYAGLVQASDGNFYGATVCGGHYGNGTVFKINSSGMLTTLHSFDTTDGELPYGGLLQATDGKLYGTTCVGGTSDNCGSGCGTVFRMNLVHSCATCRP